MSQYSLSALFGLFCRGAPAAWRTAFDVQGCGLLWAEELLFQFVNICPNEALVRTTLRAAAAYQLAWFDANVWACAEHYGPSELYSEDFEHWVGFIVQSEG